jgi:hypothetical protein
MIIIDISNIAYASMFQHIAMQKNAPINEDLLRAIVLNSVRSNVKKFKQVYANSPESIGVVLAFDSSTYWRRDLFPHYKARRAAARVSSPFDWGSIHSHMNTIMSELFLYTPYTTVKVDGAEADDVIGTLVPHFAAKEPVLIISGDKDFPQLQSDANVRQYAPVLKKFIVESLPAMQLKQLIIRGDKDDGIPNILSPDDVFVSGGRQRPISEKKLVQWLMQPPEAFCDTTMLRNYHRNQQLIDLKQIPLILRTSILAAHTEAPKVTRTQFLQYLVKKQLSQLISVIDEF